MSKRRDKRSKSEARKARFLESGVCASCGCPGHILPLRLFEAQRLCRYCWEHAKAASELDIERRTPPRLDKPAPNDLPDGTGRPESRETLYGIYCHCKRNPEAIAHDGFDEFIELVAETTYNLTEVERRRLLKLADGQLAEAIAIGEGCSREAVLWSVRNMIRKNEYCRLAARYGVLRRKKNQHE